MGEPSDWSSWNGWEWDDWSQPDWRGDDGTAESSGAARAGKGAGGEGGTSAAEGSRDAGYRSRNDEIREKARRPLLKTIKDLQQELKSARAENASLSLSLATVSTASSQAGPGRVL